MDEKKLSGFLALMYDDQITDLEVSEMMNLPLELVQARYADYEKRRETGKVAFALIEGALDIITEIL